MRSARTRHNTNCIKRGNIKRAQCCCPWSPSQEGARDQSASARRGLPSKGEARALHHQPRPSIDLDHALPRSCWMRGSRTRPRRRAGWGCGAGSFPASRKQWYSGSRCRISFFALCLAPRGNRITTACPSCNSCCSWVLEYSYYIEYQ